MKYDLDTIIRVAKAAIVGENITSDDALALTPEVLLELAELAKKMLKVYTTSGYRIMDEIEVLKKENLELKIRVQNLELGET